MNATESTGTVWRKSSYSGSYENDCVEVAQAERLVAVRDSKDPDGPVLAFGRTGWRGFVSGLKSGR
jgi:hypothetical protein